jgi:hypothetical protein
MERWEYLIEYITDSTERLDALGGDGWELVAVSAHGGSPTSTFYFKRRVAEDATELPEGLGGQRTCP